MTDQNKAELRHYPISFFAVSMGLLGLSLATHAAELTYGSEAGYAHIVLWVAFGAMTGVSLGYLGKAARHFPEVKAEWNHPVRIAFFPAVSISILLLATALVGTNKELAEPVWWLGTVPQGILALSVISAWIGHRKFAPVHISPAWFIPAVGNVIVPLAGVPLGQTDLSWLFFSAGMMFWIVLLTLVINRLMFHDPLPGRLVPTLVIMIAPPSVAFIAWVRLTGGIDAFGHVLISLSYVFAFIVLTQVGKFRRLPFALSWWALSFPIAALAVASLIYADITGSQAHLSIGLILVSLLTVVVVGLSIRTIVAIGKGEICRPE